MNIAENNNLLRLFAGDENFPHYLFKSELKFDANWNLLMVIVEKIDNTRTLSSIEETYLYCVSLNGETASILDGKTGETIVEIIRGGNWIETTYKLAVEFVKWYNEQIYNDEKRK